MPPDTHEVVKFMNEVASRALDERPSHPVVVDRPYPIGDFLGTAERHKDAGTRLPGPTRLAFVKNLVLRLLRPYATEQAGYNRAVLAAITELHHTIVDSQTDVDQRLARVQAALTSGDLLQQEFDQRVEQVDEHVVRVEGQVEALRADITELRERLAADRSELALQRARLDLFLAEARRRLPEPFDHDQLERLRAELDASLAPLYAQLEEAFRGSREEIFENQKEYLADVLALEPPGPVLDIGCGRGEWLELLQLNNVPAYGVDTNPAFVQRNVDRGLDVRQADAVVHLGSVQPGSLGAVTAFHLVEHLDFYKVVELIDAALVALRPGGVLIFETPNPTNVVVGSSAFYLDPTHLNPVHPEFLRFLVEARGFVDIQLRYLHPSLEPDFTASPDDGPEYRRMVETLNWAFFGPQDYAIVARKTKPVA